MAASNLYDGAVEIKPIARIANHYCVITDTEGVSRYVGPWRPNYRLALSDAASWLEDRGLVHPLTHEC
jgi:hypothetical protein